MRIDITKVTQASRKPAPLNQVFFPGLPFRRSGSPRQSSPIPLDNSHCRGRNSQFFFSLADDDKAHHRGWGAQRGRT
ncbi:hypothetical protein B0T14DRAFT_312319 [Immersiella caudata]|uniref:Uncharacterized protein n=1 Tax=Immersiella caudata TaxID=314043 RepID=A0AA40BV34_9PEZI|nr:hypothetical protein B0T14DRAFT_312319 [Immersiella caudata]